MRAAAALAALLIGMAMARSLPHALNVSLPPLAAPALFGFAALLALLALVFRPRIPRAALLILSLMILGAAWWITRTTITPGSLADTLARAQTSPTIITVQGRILSRPDASHHARGALAPFIPYTPAARFDLEVHRILTEAGWIDAAGTLRVRVSGVDGVDRERIGREPDSPRAGDLVTLTGTAMGLAPSANPGQPDPLEWAAQQGLAGSISLHDPALVSPASESDSLPGRLYGHFLRARADLAHAAQHALAPHPTRSQFPGADPGVAREQEARALMLSLVLGLDELREDQVQQRFTRLGVVHVMAISGYHVAVLTFLVGGLIRLTGDHGRLEPLAVAAAILAYALIVPASAPVLRACVCVIAVMLSMALGRRYDNVCVLIWTALVLALWKPVEAFSLGYVLSIGLCILLIAAGDRVHARLAGPTLRGLTPQRKSLARSALRSAGRFTTATLLCWCVSAPIIAWWTGWLSPVALLASIAIVPFVSLLLGAGFFVMLGGLVLRPLSAALSDAFSTAGSATLDAAAGLTLHAVDALDSLPLGSLRLPPLSLAWALAATCAGLFWFLRGHRSHKGAWAASAALLLWLCVSAAWQWPTLGLKGEQSLRADVLAVGDGLCVALRARDDSAAEALLVGAGSAQTSLGLRAIPAALRELGAWRVRTAIILGDQPRHFSMLPDLARAAGVERALLPHTLIELARQDPSSIQAALLTSLENVGVQVIPIEAGASMQLAHTYTVTALRGQSGLRLAITAAQHPDAAPAILITEDAPANPTHAQCVIAAGAAASPTGVAQLLRETHASLYVTSADPSDAPSGSDAIPSSVISTARRGHVGVAWTAHGPALVNNPRPTTTSPR